MSWDIFAFAVPDEISSVQELPAEYRFPPIGARSAVVAKIKELVPAARFSDLSWGIIDGDGWRIEVNVGDDEPCHSIGFFVRGGDDAVAAITRLLEGLHIRAVDGETGKLYVDPQTALKNFRVWQGFRDWVSEKIQN